MKLENYPVLTAAELDEAIHYAIEQVRSCLGDFTTWFKYPNSCKNFYPQMTNTEWTNGFWTGEVWLAYEMTKDEEKRYINILKSLKRKKKYKDFINDNISEDKIEGCFKHFIKLRTVTLQDSKANAVLNLVKNINNEISNAKILIFSNFVEDGLNILSKYFHAKNINPV